MVKFSEAILKMKLQLVLIIVIVGLLLLGCTVDIPDSNVERKELSVNSTDAEILAEFPDGLDEALTELDLVEE